MTPINKNYIVNKDTTDFNNNQTIKKGVIVKGVFVGLMPNGDIRITTDKGEIINDKDLTEQAINQIAIQQFKTGNPTQATTSDFQYYTSAKFLKEASLSVVPIGLIGYYCYNKKFSLLKSALLVSIPIVAITGLQYIVMGARKYWDVFTPPSIRANQLKKIQLIEQQTGKPQKM